MDKPLTPKKIEAALRRLPGWSRRGDALEKTFVFGDFRQAMAFMVRVAFEAEDMNHHPDWSNGYNKVVVRLSTHSAGDRITALDVELAGRIEKAKK